MKATQVLMAGILCLWALPALAQSDQDIRQVIIEQSLADYPGNCPCPYNTDRAGRRCGGRSAYSKPGGYEPLCYPQDVSDAMVETYRRQHGLEQGARSEPAE